MRARLALILIFLTSLQSLAAIYYVNQNVTGGTGSGNSWVNAFPSLQNALDVAAASDEIWVANGIYLPEKDPFGNDSPADIRDKTFYIPDGVKLYGGFSGTETDKSQRNPANQSILDGDFLGNGTQTEFAYHVVLMVNASSTTVLDGFLIRNGFANVYTGITVATYTIARSNGGGIHLVHSAPQFVHLNLEANSCIDYAGGMYVVDGSEPTLNHVIFDTNSSARTCGALYANNSTLTLTDVWFNANSALYEAGALSCTNCTVSLTDCQFETNMCQFAAGAVSFKQTSGNMTGTLFLSNSSTNGSGAVSLDNASPVITNAFFWDNISKYAEGALSTGALGSAVTANPVLENVVFAENSSEYGTGAVRVSKGNATFTNCTFYKNASIYSAGGLTNSVTDLQLTNSLFFENSQNGSTAASYCDISNASTATMLINHSLLQLANTPTNYPSGNFPELGSGSNLFNLNPSFRNVADLNGADDIWLTADDGLALLSGSACVNAGTAVAAPVTDITGTPRSGNPEIGAYEFTGAACPDNLTTSGLLSNDQKANLTINTSGTNSIASSSNVSYQAGNYIHLNPGFSTETNSVFMTRLLGGCQ